VKATSLGRATEFASSSRRASGKSSKTRIDERRLLGLPFLERNARQAGFHIRAVFLVEFFDLRVGDG
jgi:hypothetical protein